MIINEAVSSNAEFKDEDGDSEDWFELHNHSNSAVRLTGWSLSDDAMEPQKWQFPDISVSAGGYVVVWASDKDRAIADKPLHVNFKISSSGETLYLFDGSGKQVHSLVINGLRTGTSVGLSASSKAVVYYDQPTPGVVNSAQEYLGVVNDGVQFSDKGGVTSASMVMLTGAQANQTIRYTLDGSVPTAASPVYQGALLIPENTAVRARIFADRFIPSPTQSRTFLVNASHDIPVVTLEADPLDFFDMEYGIYVLGANYDRQPPNYGANFWQDWEREIHFAFYETDGQFGTEFSAGVQIFGGYTRSFCSKSVGFLCSSPLRRRQIRLSIFPGSELQKI
ncbi:MAG: lamin tail domain-containing protein [Cellvibrionaceae bacterium]|nr:lamin tail domain-containing protein [Cellvibrionaceae bacterium]